MSGVKEELHAKLRGSRQALLENLDGLSEYDLRRPMTPTGTNLLGLVKHLTGLEYHYLGESFGRPGPEVLPWVEDGSIMEGGDMWAKPDESRDYITGLYERACAHADETIDELSLDAPGSVPHWPPDRRETTLGFLLIRMVAETAQHAGHADIVREMIDGRGGPDQESISESDWRAYLARFRLRRTHSAEALGGRGRVFTQPRSCGGRGADVVETQQSRANYRGNVSYPDLSAGQLGRRAVGDGPFSSGSQAASRLPPRTTWTPAPVRPRAAEARPGHARGPGQRSRD